MSRYFIEQADGPPEGPVEFRDLVTRVRQGSVVADQRVREAHGDWTYAGEVVGLFAMAGRSDALEIWEADRREQAAAERALNADDGWAADETLDLRDLESADADSPDDDSVEARWQRRLREVTEERAAASIGTGGTRRVWTRRHFAGFRN